MFRIKQAFKIAGHNFLRWRRNPRIIITFALAFILCFFLSDKAVRLAKEFGTSMQIVEAFVWTFGDSNSIMLSSLLLMLLFADMPFISPVTPFYLVRTNRKTWVAGQLIYIFTATFIYMLFILAATSLVCMTQSFTANMWSETAAILGYSGTGEVVALPALVKTLEMSTPYPCAATIFVLMLLYTLMLMFIMMTFNLKKGQMAGVVSVFGVSLYGFLLNPQIIKTIFNLSDKAMYKANVAVGWLSPLNQATYHMHNFGYDLLPKLWQTYLIFAALIVLLFILVIKAMSGYNFNYLGTENS